MTFPKWLNDQIGSFGRQMRLDGLALGERGSAGVRFADGAELRFEYARERLAVMVTHPVDVDDPEVAKTVLAAAHPMARRSLRLRSGFLRKDSKAFFVVRIPEREVTVEMLSRAFNEVWSVAKTLERRLS